MTNKEERRLLTFLEESTRKQMTPKEIERLEELAKAATPGPWGFRFGQVVDNLDYMLVDKFPGRKDTDAKYIAAANPKAALALIDRIQSDDVKLKRTVNAAYHALLEMSAWMGIPEKKRMKQIYHLMENVKYCAENDLREQDKLNPLPEDDQ